MSAQNTVQGAIGFQISGLAARVMDALSAPQFSLPATLNQTLNLSTGSGAGNADLLYPKTITLSGTTPYELDFGGGTLEDDFGELITLGSIRAFLVINDCDAGSKTIEILGGAADVASLMTGTIGTNGLKVRGLGGWALVAVGAADASGYAVAGGEKFTITPSASGSCRVVFFGVHA